MTSSNVLDQLRYRIRQRTHADELEVVDGLIQLAAGQQSEAERESVLVRARDLVSRCREASDEAGTLDAFLQEFGLSNPEGVALMCLAEALLRVPDDETADRLIAEKIQSGDWAAHRGKSESLFVNGSVWGLMLTGRFVNLEPEIEQQPGTWMERLVTRVGEPLVRTAVVQAMRILGRQYVLGRSIEEALERSDRRDNRASLYSFDMLGEGARTQADADQYFTAYRTAIDAIGRFSSSTDPLSSDSISVKLSALHPRYQSAQRQTVLKELPGKLTALAALARRYGLGLSIDAEEAARLALSLDIFEKLARDPALAGWNGLGFVLQAYQKRAPLVAEWLIALARETDHRIIVRLVKGAYWDAEIKRAQVQGFLDYPVFTRKSSTDLCYQVCAGLLLEAPQEIYPQFATHNATTACQVLALGHGRSMELQRLHGMGELLYRELLADDRFQVPLRVYAPVGSHRDLLPYLVRRLLENGANSSFVNRFLDNAVSVRSLVTDPLTETLGHTFRRHPGIPLPLNIYQAAGEPRQAAEGLDLDDTGVWESLHSEFERLAGSTWAAAADSDATQPAASGRSISSPADKHHTLGQVLDASAEAVEQALTTAATAQPAWDGCGGAARAAILDRAADLLAGHRSELMYLIGAEGGRTVADALSEVREAVDFCRYYALHCRAEFTTERPLPGPTGEHNALSLHGRGTFACISPWNFPLAIFTGQVSAGLAAGNCVLAKPAEQTPLVAALATRLLHQAGVPEDVLQLLPGSGQRIGGILSQDNRINGIAFTGSTATAQLINRQLAARSGPIVPLIAETGGQNVMIADSTALSEQLVDDVLTSAFRSAGQRCSALRVLYLQEDIAEPVLQMLRGAMQTLVIGDPLNIATDVGPVIDSSASAGLQRHVDHLEETAVLIARCDLPAECSQGSFFPPQVFEIDSITRLTEEVFGPILHVIRYDPDDLARILAEINDTGFGLTLGIHSRIEGFAREVFEKTRVGNTYVNRDMVGAVVGVQPFGGQGLSGTGPKAGGPDYLHRFAVEKTWTENTTARGGNAALFELEVR